MVPLVAFHAARAGALLLDDVSAPFMNTGFSKQVAILFTCSRLPEYAVWSIASGKYHRIRLGRRTYTPLLACANVEDTKHKSRASFFADILRPQSGATGRPRAEPRRNGVRSQSDGSQSLSS
jgi:hypothetical protein